MKKLLVYAGIAACFVAVFFILADAAELGYKINHDPAFKTYQRVR